MKYTTVVGILAGVCVLGGFWFSYKAIKRNPARVYYGSTTTTDVPIPTSRPKPITGDIHTIFEYVSPERMASSSRTYTLAATGDVMLGRSVHATLLRQKSFTYPFDRTADVLKRADMTMVNLESPLVPDCPVIEGGFTFCGDTRSVAGLTLAGVDLVTIANNHATNFGQDGIRSTKDALTSENIKILGGGSPTVLTIKGKKFGFVGYTYVGRPETGIDWADRKRVVDDITTLKSQVDFVITTIHWGNEYVDSPTSAQKEMGRAMVQAGAHLVVGHHPHWVQAVEWVDSSLIVYSLGNFVFDQSWSRETSEGAAGWFEFDDLGLRSLHFLPVIIEATQPRWATRQEAEPILLRMQNPSRLLLAPSPLPTDF